MSFPEYEYIKSAFTTEAWGELSQSLRIEISWLGQLQDLQMLLKDFLSFLQDINTTEISVGKTL